LLLVLCALSFTVAVRAVVNDSPSGLPAESSDAPYTAIWLRNVFDLKPPAAPLSDAVKSNAPPPNIHLTGITTILGNKRALFLVEKSAQPGKPANKPESFILTEGQRQDILEVIKINPELATVNIKVAGVLSTIGFDTNHAAGSPILAGGRPSHLPFQPASFAPQPQPGFGNNFSMPLPNRSAAGYQPNNYSGQNAVAGGLALNTGSRAQTGLFPGQSVPAPSTDTGSAANTPAQNSQQFSAPPDVTAAILAARAAAGAAGSSGSSGSSSSSSSGSSSSGGTGSTTTVPTAPTQTATNPTLPNLPAVPELPNFPAVPPLPSSPPSTGP
jgi:uncharacterized membrane protein YgcG